MADKLMFHELFGNTDRTRIIQEIAADPTHCVTIQDISRLTDIPESYVKETFIILENNNLISKCNDCIGYEVNFNSKRWAAITLLLFATVDDSCESELFLKGVQEYASGRTSVFMPFGRSDKQ
jgi:hypothetical protein